MATKTPTSTPTPTSIFDVNDTAGVKRSYLIGVILLVILIAIFVGYSQYKKILTKQNTSVQSNFKVDKINIEFSKLPSRFPANIPIEAGSKLTQNYNATSKDGVFQATRTFVTKQTLAANQTLYTDFLKKDGWNIGSGTDEPSYKMVMGTKDKKSLLIIIDENNVSNIKTVSISYSETK